MSSRRSPKRRQAVPLTPSCIIMEAVKWIAFVLVLVLLFMGNRKDKPSETPFEAMKTAVLKEAKLPDAKEAENQMVRRLYGIDPSNFDGVYLAAPSTNMDVNELLILRVRGGHEKEMAAEAVQARLDAQLSAFEGYGVIQTGLLSHAVIENRGDYILYYVGEDPENVQRAFSEAL